MAVRSNAWYFLSQILSHLIWMCPYDITLNCIKVTPLVFLSAIQTYKETDLRDNTHTGWETEVREQIVGEARLEVMCPPLVLIPVQDITLSPTTVEETCFPQVSFKIVANYSETHGMCVTFWVDSRGAGVYPKWAPSFVPQSVHTHMPKHSSTCYIISSFLILCYSCCQF